MDNADELRRGRFKDIPQTDPNSQFGSMGTISRAPGGVRAQGWAIDSNVGTGPINVVIYDGATDMGGAAANNYRSDVAGSDTPAFFFGII